MLCAFYCSMYNTPFLLYRVFLGFCVVYVLYSGAYLGFKSNPIHYRINQPSLPKQLKVSIETSTHKKTTSASASLPLQQTHALNAPQSSLHARNTQIGYGHQNTSNTKSTAHNLKLFAGGGMQPSEQDLLKRAISNASSMFEWGMGSSTMIAHYLNISRLTSVDSSQHWVQKIKTTLGHRAYKLIYADIGRVKMWGVPVDSSYKAAWPNYSAHVDAETGSFDIYLVDGRFRVACASLALKHGHSRSLVLVHDWKRSKYHVLLDVAEVVANIQNLVVLKRRLSITDNDLLALWHRYKYDWA